MIAERDSRTATLPVLVVDDEAGMRNLLCASLELMGYRTEVASGAGEARELLRRRAYSLVLCDYEMPGATGLDLLTYKMQVHPDLPFIMLTGHAESPLARAAISAGAIDFLCKPFEVDQLERVIEQNWARLERDRKRAADLTMEVLNGTIRALVAAIDAKDPHTASHSERVTSLARQLGRAVGLSTDRLRILEFSALLHDVGKIGVPEGILLKQDRLNEQEWAIIRQHPIRSAEIVAKVGALAEVATVVRHHHERMDGTGYPDGLAGDAIPYLARVISIVDAYEAMTADRAYRPARTRAQAMDLVSRGLGTQFDRELGEQFLSIDALP